MINVQLTAGQAQLLITTLREASRQQAEIAAATEWPAKDLAKATAVQLDATEAVIRTAVKTLIAAQHRCRTEYATAGLDATIEIESFEKLTAEQLDDEVVYLGDYQG